MASKKRKSTVAGSAAKHQKIAKGHECPSHTPNKTSGVTKPPKRNSASTQKKNALKRPVKAKPANKAIKKPLSNVNKKQKQVLLKNKNELKASKRTVKNVPVKVSKEGMSSRKNAQLSQKSLGHTSKTSKKSTDGTNKATTKKANLNNNKKALSKVGKNTRKSPPIARLKAASAKNEKSVVATKRNCKVLNQKVGKVQNKPPSKANNKKELLNSKAKIVKQVAQHKGNDIPLRVKMEKKPIQTISGRQSKLMGKKQAQICTITEAQPKKNHSKRCANPLRKNLKTPSSNKNDRDSKRSQCLTSLSPECRKAKKKQKSKGVERNSDTKSTGLRGKPKKQNDRTIRKASQIDDNKILNGKDPPNDCQSKVISCKSKKCLIVNKLELSSSPDPTLRESFVKKTSVDTKHLKNKLSCIDNSAKRKAVENKSITRKIMEKRQKIVHSGTERSSPIPGPAETTKSKRISILDLCNEIAGEIESDTVEVMKDPLSSQEPHNENNSTEEKKESTSSESVNAAHTSESDINPSKRFFPSRTPLRMKCKLDRKISPAQRSSKWSKIKLKKVNNFSQSDVPCSPAVLPNLDMIKVNSKLSQINQATSSTLNKLLDAKLPDQLAVNKLDLKKTRTGAINQKILEQKKIPENGTLENHKKFNLEVAVDEGFRLHLDSSPENSPLKMNSVTSPPFKSEQQGTEEIVSKACVSKQLFSISVADQITPADGRRSAVTSHLPAAKSNVNIQKEIKKLKEVEKDSNRQPVIDAGQKRFGAISCNVCGMLYTASNPEDESQHLLFHNQFISAVKYIGWKKERTVSEYPDGKIIMVLPDDPKYALKKVEEIREMVDNDLGFQQAPLRLHSRTKTLLFISNEKKVVGCLIAEHIQCGYRVIVDLDPDGRSEKEKAISERVKAWCCSTTPEPAICGISRIWVFSMMRRNKIASRMIDCLRNNFIYGSFLNKEEIAFSDPTPDGKLFATHYCGTGQFLVYNFVSGHNERN